LAEEKITFENSIHLAFDALQGYQILGFIDSCDKLKSPKKKLESLRLTLLDNMPFLGYAVCDGSIMAAPVVLMKLKIAICDCLVCASSLFF
jgi:hypothetical protein